MMSSRCRWSHVAAIVVALVSATAVAASADCVSRANYGNGIVFVTDREPLGDDRIFGGERAVGRDPDESVTAGTLSEARPAGTRGCTSRLSYFQALDHRFVRGHGRRALVYVHGYYTSFVTAARDALALRRELHFPGPVILYSWPATVTAKPAYGLESRNASWSSPHFTSFVNDLQAHFHGMPLSFVARGVGARFATAGLRIVRDPRCRDCFGRAVLVEPEIDGDLLRRKLGEAKLCDVRRDPRRTAAPVTVYTARLKPSRCSGIDTIRVAAAVISPRDGRDPATTSPLAYDVRGALAGIPRVARARRQERPRSRLRASL